MNRIRSGMGFRSDLYVLRERLSSGELIHDVFNGLLGIVPGLVRPGSRTDLRHRFFLDMWLNRRGTGGARKGIEWGRKFEQRFTSRRFCALRLSQGTTRLLGSMFRNLLDGLIGLREIILTHIRPQRLLLFLRLRGNKWRRCGNKRGLRKCRRWFRKVGDRSSAEVREVRNGLETRHQLI
jgi:hypothetical protein